MTLEEQDIVSRGLAAADLLSHPAFADTIKSLAVECFATFTETEPYEGSKREDSYNLYRGLKAIEAELNQRVSAKVQIEDRLNAENELDEDIDGPILLQGNTDQ